MIKKLFLQYEPGKSKLIKLIALCIKAVTGVVGASMILTEQNPYLSLGILCVGTVANEMINFINEKGRSRTIKLIALCIKGITGILGASMILTEQRPYLTLIILSIGAISNEILIFLNLENSPEVIAEPVNPLQS